MANRIDAMFAPMGLLLLALIILIAVLRLVRSRSMKGGGIGDPLDPHDEDTSGSRGASRPTIHSDFRSVLDRLLLPRRAAHPDWERLDGAYDVKGRVIASFTHNGTVYSINGESTFDAIERVDAWMQEHPGEDPFIVPKGQGARGRLVLRPEIGVEDPKSLRIETA